MLHTETFLESFILEQAKSLLLEDGGWIKASELLARLPANATRPAHPGAHLYQWVWEKRLFAITQGNVDYFPVFAMLFFPALEPAPALATVIAELGATDWALGAWFSLPHEMLAGRRPRDLLLEFPDQVISAAKQTALLRFHMQST